MSGCVSCSSCLAELVGTFLLVLAIGCVGLSGTSEAWGPTAIANALVALIYSFGAVSGGHFNPAVSFAAALTSKVSVATAVYYILLQACAGVAAGFACGELYGAAAPLEPKPGVEWWEEMIVEVLYTAVFVFVVLSVTSERNHPKSNPNQFYGLAIGFVIIAAGAAGGKISGALLNPAVSLGLDISGSSALPARGATYTGYQIGGAVVASLLFWLTHPEEYMDEEDIQTYEPIFSTRLAAEFIGTFVIVLTATLCAFTSSLASPWAVGAAVMCMVYAIGDVSGGHFNPAVTLAVWLCRKVDINFCQALFYMVIQAAAGTLAGVLGAGLVGVVTLPLEPKKPYTEKAALLMEAIFTFVIALTVLTTAYDKGITTRLMRNYYFGLAVGASVSAGGFACAHVSGGALNPAVSLGFGVSHAINDGSLSSSLTYSLAQLAGGVASVLVFAVVRAEVYNPKRSQLQRFHKESEGDERAPLSRSWGEMIKSWIGGRRSARQGSDS